MSYANQNHPTTLAFLATTLDQLGEMDDAKGTLAVARTRQATRLGDRADL